MFCTRENGKKTRIFTELSIKKRRKMWKFWKSLWFKTLSIKRNCFTSGSVKNFKTHSKRVFKPSYFSWKIIMRMDEMRTFEMFVWFWWDGFNLQYNQKSLRQQIFAVHWILKMHPRKIKRITSEKEGELRVKRKSIDTC